MQTCLEVRLRLLYSERLASNLCVAVSAVGLGKGRYFW
jgi:hypothetical protein